MSTDTKEETVVGEDDKPDHHIRIPVATKHIHYKIGNYTRWFRKITKQEAKKNSLSVKSVFGDNSIGWFVPVWLGDESDT